MTNLKQFERELLRLESELECPYCAYQNVLKHLEKSKFIDINELVEKMNQKYYIEVSKEEI